MNKPSSLIKVTITVALMTASAQAKQNSDDSLIKYTLKKDLQRLQTTSEVGPKAFDKEHNGLFSKIFGGTKGSDLKSFFDERIKHAFTQEEFSKLRFSASLPNPWPDKLVAQDKKPKAKSVIKASNMGAVIFLKSIMTQTPVSLISDSEEIPVSSPRAGVMIFGPGYLAKDALGSRTIEAPSEHRIEMLLHEARHSDCTGGLTQHDLDQVRGIRNFTNFLEAFDKKSCGHFHSICPDNHMFKNIPACDSEPWGAYAVGAIYASAASKNLSGAYKAVMEAVALDSFGRLTNGSKEALLNGQMGEPDMANTEPVWE